MQCLHMHTHARPTSWVICKTRTAYALWVDHDHFPFYVCVFARYTYDMCHDGATMIIVVGLNLFYAHYFKDDKVSTFPNAVLYVALFKVSFSAQIEACNENDYKFHRKSRLCWGTLYKKSALFCFDVLCYAPQMNTFRLNCAAQ